MSVSCVALRCQATAEYSLHSLLSSALRALVVSRRSISPETRRLVSAYSSNTSRHAIRSTARSRDARLRLSGLTALPIASCPKSASTNTRFLASQVEHQAIIHLLPPADACPSSLKPDLTKQQSTAPIAEYCRSARFPKVLASFRDPDLLESARSNGAIHEQTVHPTDRSHSRTCNHALLTFFDVTATLSFVPAGDSSLDPASPVNNGSHCSSLHVAFECWKPAR